LEFVQIDIDDGRPPFGGQLKAGLSSWQKGYLAMPRKPKYRKPSPPQVRGRSWRRQARNLAFTGFPKERWRQLWSKDSLEQLNKEIAAALTWSASSDRAPILRLVGALLVPPRDPYEEVIVIETAVRRIRGEWPQTQLTARAEVGFPHRRKPTIVGRRARFGRWREGHDSG
jgi:hypothetical protein